MASNQGGKNEGGPALIPLAHHEGKPPIPLHRPVMVVGARRDAHIHLISKSVSQTHAIFVIAGSHVYVRDMASRMHVYVNDQQVREAELAEGDQIRIGDFQFQITLGVGGDDPPPAAPEGMLEMEGEGLPSPLSGRTTIIGRRASNDIVIDDESVSTVHAVIAERAGVRVIRDLGSRTGTFVNGKKIHQTEIAFGDEIKIGPAVIHYQVTGGGEHRAAESMAGDVSLEAPMISVPETTAAPAADAGEHQEEDPFIVPEPEAEAPAPAEEEAAPAPIPIDVGGEAPAQDEVTLTTTPAADEGEMTAIPMEPLPMADEAASTDEVSLGEVGETHEVSEPQDEELAPLSMEEEPSEEPEPEPAPLTFETPEIDLQEMGRVEPLAFEVEEDHASGNGSTEEFVGVRKTPVAPSAKVTAPEAAPRMMDEEVAPLEMGTVEPAEELPIPGLAMDAQGDEEPELPPMPAMPAAPVAGMDLDFSVPAFEMPKVEPLDFGGGGGVGAGEKMGAPAIGPVDEGGLSFSVGGGDVASLGVVDEVDVSALGFGPAVDEAAPVAPVKRKPTPPATAKPQAVKKAPRVEPIAPVAEAAAIAPLALDAAIPELPMSSTAEAIADVGIAAAGIVEDAVPPLDFAAPAAAPARPKRMVSKPLAKSKPVAPVAPPLAPVAEAPAAPREQSAPIEMAPIEVEPPPAPEISSTESAIGLEVGSELPTAEAAEPAKPQPAEGGEGEKEKRWWFKKRPEKPVAEEPEAPVADISVAAGPGEGELTAMPEAEAVLSDETLTITTPPPVENLGQVSPENAGAAPPAAEAAPMGSLGGVVDLGSGDLAFFGGMPLQLDELKGPPSTFGRVTYDFGDKALPPKVQPGPAVPSPEPMPVEEIPEALAEPDVELGDDAIVASSEEDFTVDFEDEGGGATTVQEPPKRAPEPPPAAKPPAAKPPAAKAPAAKTPPRPKMPSLSGQGLVEAPLDVDEALPGAASAEAFQGLAMPPMRDVFSNLPQPKADDPVFGKGRGGGMGTVPPPAAGDARGRGAGGGGAAPIAPAEEEERVISAPDDEGWAAAEAETIAPPAEVKRAPKKKKQPTPKPVVAAAPRKRRKFLPRVSILILLMILFMAGAAAAIWYFYPRQAKIEGSLNFRRFESLSARDQNALKEEQRQILLDSITRNTAAQIVENTGQQKIAGGFLSDPLAFAKTISQAESTFWQNPKPGKFTLVVDSMDPDGDKQRIKALLTVMYLDKRNAIRVAAASRANEAKDLDAQNTRLRDRIRELTGLLDEQQRLSKNRPADAQLKELEELSDEREKLWQRAAAEVLQLKFQIEQLKKPAAPTTQGGSEDPALKQLEMELAQASKSITAARSAAHNDVDEAKRSLDQAIESFQQQTQATQERAKDFPELKAYLIAATDLKEATRQLTGDLIQSQKEQHERLVDMQRRLQESWDAKQATLFKSDPELHDLSEQLALTRRKYNASLSTGSEHEQETNALKAEVDRLNERIAARMKALGDDGSTAQVIAQLQEEITTSQKVLDENRGRAQQTLDRLQKNLASVAPAVEKLPAEQKDLATALQKKLADIATAREQYTTAMENKAAHGDVNLAKLQSSAAEIQSKIDTRKQELEARRAKNADQEEQAKMALVAKQQVELDAAKRRANDAEAALLKSRMDVVLLKQAKETADHASEARDNYQAELDQAKQDLTRVNEKLANRGKEATALAYPEEPTMENVKVVAESDKRPQVAAASAGGIGVFFILLMAISARKPKRDSFEMMAEEAGMFQGLRTE